MQSYDLGYGSCPVVFTIRALSSFEFFTKEVDFNFIAAQIALARISGGGIRGFYF